MNIAFTENTHPGTLPPSDQLGFGSVFTDHMFLMDYSAGKGWHDARIVPYGPISLSPAASVLHYGTEVFEGLKAYRRPDGGVQLFRPWENVARLNRSCERLGLPQLDPDDALQAIKEIVRVDQRWVPNDPGTSLYIRPFLYSTDPTLALHGVHEASFVIILSPSGSYFSDGLKPVPIMVETEDVRAVRGGTGEAKCGGNYGAANRAGERAEAKGYSQVLWLDGVERKYVDNFERVQAGQPILRLVNPVTSTVQFTLPENALPLLRDSSTRFTVAFDNYRGAAIPARLKEYVETSSDASGFPVSLTLENPDPARYRISPGMSCTITMLSADPVPDAVSLPVSAVYAPAGGGTYVWIVGAGDRVMRREVTLGELFEETYIQGEIAIRSYDSTGTTIEHYLGDAEEFYPDEHPQILEREVGYIFPLMELEPTICIELKNEEDEG